MNYWICLLLCSFMIQGQSQCLISQGHFFLNYNTADCNGLNFQYAIGALVLPYGSCNGNDYVTPLFNPDFTTSAEEFRKNIECKLFPNPFYSDLLIRFDDFQKVKSIQMYSAIGDLISSYKINAEIKEWSMDCSKLPASYYFIKIIFSNERIMTKSILKMNIH